MQEYNIEAPVIPLLASKSSNIFRLFSSDIGLLTSAYPAETKMELINKNGEVNNGAHFENAVAQQLTANGFTPYFCKKKNIGEMDFVIEINGKVVKVDLDRQILKPLCGKGFMLCYDSPEYVKDMGTPERYYAVENDYKKGIVSAKNLANKQKAVFLDRDGTINVYKGFLRDIDEFELIDGVADAIKKINNSGYLCIVVTNQPVIARGEVTYEQLDMIHKKMETLLGLDGAYIDGLYYCPHHPHKGYEGEIPELKIDCKCRKPKPGMLYMAEKDFNISLSDSFMVGDGENDIIAGNAAGCRSVLIANKQENTIDKGIAADVVNDVVEFVDKYISNI